MKIKLLVLTLLFFMSAIHLFGQQLTLNGTVYIENIPTEFVLVHILDLEKSTTTNAKGRFAFENISPGTYQVEASFIGYKSISQSITIRPNQLKSNIDFNLTESTLQMENVVITGTKTNKRQTNSPVIVNVVNSETISNLQVCNLSEGLKFQPGLRVETDCQTCNYTQLRMNGLAGGYAQILINGRPIFSPLTGLYGMEQIPANMIDRIEVVRGGGSSLYGSSAIGGTVNVITKIPKKNSYAIDATYQHVGGQTPDWITNGNATLVSKNYDAGISFFLNHRDRNFYDANADNYSELPLLKNTGIGSNMFFIPAENQKIDLNFNYLNEYRYGGEMILNKPPHFAQQSEERLHDVWMASADYQINFNKSKSSFIAYAAWQNTKRKHYTGIAPDTSSSDYTAFLENPPYGHSDVSTYNVGVQINHKTHPFNLGNNVWTLGGEYVVDDVLDVIDAYKYSVDQTTKNFGIFLQSDWAFSKSLTLLSGVRVDKHNMVSNPIVSPRISLLYKRFKNTQFRLSYGSGFRAPQAFDTDLHIAFAGGGVSRVVLAESLKQERSHSYSASINYDKPMENWIAGATIEGFYNRLNNAFYLDPKGADQFGEVFEKKNGAGAIVKGGTIELRANYDRKLQLEGGFTLQSSAFDNPVYYIDGLEPIKQFIRTPADYGYVIFTATPTKKISATLNYVYTGRMIMPHFAGAENHTKDVYFDTPAFSEISTKVAYTFALPSVSSNLTCYAGVKNMTNAYQKSFDIGKNRDSNFVFGPAQPRTFYIGLKITEL